MNIEKKLKAFDDWCDKNAKTPEKAEYGKAKIREALANVPPGPFQGLALDAAILLAKASSDK